MLAVTPSLGSLRDQGQQRLSCDEVFDGQQAAGVADRFGAVHPTCRAFGHASAEAVAGHLQCHRCPVRRTVRPDPGPQPPESRWTAWCERVWYASMSGEATPGMPAMDELTNGEAMDGEARLRRSVEFGVWCAALAGGTALVHALGTGSLAAPPTDPATWATWLDGRDPLVASMALLRLLVLAVCWYLVGVTSVGLVARLLRATRLLRIADALTLPPVRRLLQQTLGVALATAMVTSVTSPGGGAVSTPSTVRLAAAAAEDDGSTPDGSTPDGSLGGAEGPVASTGEGPPSVTLRGLPYPPIAGRAGPDATVVDPVEPGHSAPDAAVSPPTRPSAPTRPLAPATVLLPWQVGSEPGAAGDREGTDHPEASTAPTASTASTASTGPTGPTGPTAPSASTDDPGPVIHTVRTGESLWRIASAQLAQEHGRSPSDAEVVPYWRELIERNRDRLPDRDDPDLILPGQELLLPPVLP
ncbi:MAG: LysM peptidoglycan-binding domain-containing protein [Nitriliruptor sp.]|nr:MAG: LysM peptidoglycan-binding domain-containing protein [Nitriliruptor sp.]